jgi:hypothetical protein
MRRHCYAPSFLAARDWLSTSEDEFLTPLDSAREWSGGRLASPSSACAQFSHQKGAHAEGYGTGGDEDENGIRSPHVAKELR